MTPTGLRTAQAAMGAWAAEFGCAPQVLGAALTTVIRHGPAFAGHRVAFALAATATNACVVTVPADWYDVASAALAPLPPSQAFDARRLGGVFGRAAERVVGPAWQGHLDAA
jgi:hypothetical protein